MCFSCLFNNCKLNSQWSKIYKHDKYIRQYTNCATFPWLVYLPTIINRLIYIFWWLIILLFIYYSITYYFIIILFKLILLKINAVIIYWAHAVVIHSTRIKSRKSLYKINFNSLITFSRSLQCLAFILCCIKFK